MLLYLELFIAAFKYVAHIVLELNVKNSDSLSYRLEINRFFLINVMSANEKRNYLPVLWGHDVRMNSLMSEFRQKHLNPFGYQEKLAFWEENLIRWCKHCRKVCFTHSEACLAFERNGRQPECLQTVINEMIEEGKLLTEEQFFSSQQDWFSWTYYMLVKKPLLWSWKTAMNMLNWNNKEQRYISILNMKEMIDQVMKIRHNQVSNEWVDNVISLDDLWQQSKEICANQETFQLILCQLEKEKQIYIFNIYSQKFVKFRRKDELVVSKPTEVEIDMRRLLHAKRILEKEIEKLEREIENKRDEAKSEISKGHKDRASMLLRHKKRFENDLKKKVNTLDNLESLLNKIQQSNSEKAVLQAYKAGVMALKKLNLGDYSLEKVEATMANIEETLEEQNEIEAAIAKPIGFDSKIEVTDSDLELELEDILDDDVSHLGNIAAISKLEVPAEEPKLEFEDSRNQIKQIAVKQ